MPLTQFSGRRVLFLLAIIISLTGLSPVKAQLVADFIPSATAGCSPLAVNFVNTSTGTSCFVGLYLDVWKWKWYYDYREK